MRIIPTGNKDLLMNRIQCLRDTAEALDLNIDQLIEKRQDCCEEPSSSAP